MLECCWITGFYLVDRRLGHGDTAAGNLSEAVVHYGRMNDWASGLNRPVGFTTAE